MIKTCNNCDVNFCNPGRKSYCNNHRKLVSMVPLRQLVSKVTITKAPTTEATLYLLRNWM